MVFVGKRGKRYEEYANKFLKGTIVGEWQDYYDIETKNFLYEVKGVKLFQKNKKNFTKTGLYQIRVDNHAKFIANSMERNKKAKYFFVLEVGSRKIYKTMTWESVERIICDLNTSKHRNKDVCSLSIKSIWM